MERLYDYLHFVIFVIFLLCSLCSGGKTKKSLDDDDTNDDQKDDSMDISPSDLPELPINETVCTRRKNTQVHEVTSARPGQFPFMVAIMSPRNEYVCAGSLISNGLVLTTAQCTESVGYVLVNATKDNKDDGAVSLQIIKSENFPSYTGPNSEKDAALIYTEKHNKTIASKITLSNYTASGALENIEAIGFGLNADVGEVKELQYVGLDPRDIKRDSITGYIDCIDTKVSTCFKDKGGPLIFDNELVGLITDGQSECTNEIVSTYAINKRMVNAMPIYTIKAWLDEKIAKHTAPGDDRLESFPKKPAPRVGFVHRMTAKGAGNINTIRFYHLLLALLVLLTQIC